ncbi:hypothetical protein RHGRI_003546 [Rhododendron griersonianum]|uniref:Uncharacterized protein n=1 Tax=Rhododendron griersonianum TaxID=479676 RepID=A0AAV6L687_9ERIC|nr:hypothetical protein RHGRI_003546 [Rhododendron griersonianum]
MLDVLVLMVSMIVGHSVLCYVKLKYFFVKPRKLIKLLKWSRQGSGKRVVLVATVHAKEEKKMGIQRGGMATLVELSYDSYRRRRRPTFWRPNAKYSKVVCWTYKMETSPIGSQGDGLNACGLGGPWMAVGLYWLGGVSGWSTGYIWEGWGLWGVMVVGLLPTPILGG